MQYRFILSVLMILAYFQLKAQDTTLLDPVYRPFYHGVASGDPLQDRVIIWTRITPEAPGNPVTGTWEVATDTAMTQVVQSGVFMTDGSVDYTVKVDVTGLDPGQTYYYMFEALGRKSLIGRTRTAPAIGMTDHLKFVHVSCASYESGYFNAYGRIADRNDLDAVIHLGDYYYEYPSGVFADTNLVNAGLRVVDSTGAISLEQYRERFALYRLDPDLRRAHQQHPFICAWDDHESANNAYTLGAENHDPATEGPWEDRKNDSKQAFFEWLPVRNQAQNIIYRKFSYGGLADLLMMDTRLEGRDKQIELLPDSALWDPNRSIIDSAQRSWLYNELQTSQATWKLIGNQVLFTEIHVGWISLFDTTRTPDEAESEFLDSWEGYPVERANLMDHIESNQIDNVVFLTGDMHTALAWDVADSVVDPANNYVSLPNYDRETGAGSIAVEFLTPSISAWNFNEAFGDLLTLFLESQINGPVLGLGNVPNPHLKFVDLDRHGYTLMDIRPDSVQGNFYFVDRLDMPSQIEAFDTALYTLLGENHLRAAQVESPPKSIQEIPAPDLPPNPGVAIDPLQPEFRFQHYPNPATDWVEVTFSIEKRADIQVLIRGITGQTILQIPSRPYPAGTHSVTLDTHFLAPGVYHLVIDDGTSKAFRKMIIMK